MKNIYFTLIIILITAAYGTLYSQPVQIEIFPDQVLERSYLGNGVQWSAYPQKDISEKSWQRVYERVDFMKLNFIRLVLFSNDYCQSFPVDGKPLYDFNSEKILRVCRILDYCQNRGVDVMLGEWNSPEIDGITMTDPRWTEMVGGFLSYLINTKHYSCIKFYNLGNEPNGKDGYAELWKAGSSKNFDNWKISILNLDKELQKRGLREKIKIAGPDCSNGNDWIKRIISDKELCSVIDIYEVHRYARDKEIEDGEFGEEMKYYRNYITRHDPDGINKQFFMGEAGMITGRNKVDQQKMIATFKYGVWMADYIVQSMNAGQAGLIAWDLDDAMHTNGKLGPGEDIKDYIWKEWGFWDSFGEEKGAPELTNMRPWFYTWSLLSRYIPRGSQVIKTSEPGLKGLRNTAARITVNDKTEYTFVIVNDSDEERAVKFISDGIKGIDLKQYNYFETDMPKDTDGFPVAKNIVRNANLNKGVIIKLPSRGVIILTSLK